MPRAGVAHCRHDFPRHQAAADVLVPGDVADRDGQERDQLGRAGSEAWDQAGQRWSLKQKIMAVMAEQESRKRLDGRVEMDDACLGGHRAGWRGRGAAGRQPFVAAASPASPGAATEAPTRSSQGSSTAPSGPLPGLAINSRQADDEG